MSPPDFFFLCDAGRRAWPLFASPCATCAAACAFTALRSCGQPLKIIDREGNPTTYSYDAINRLLTTTTALPATTAFQYDPVGNRTAITDANGHTTTFAYDKVNRQISETYPDLSNNTITWTYDQVGNVITRTDQKSQITTYTYSDLYFLMSRAYPQRKYGHFHLRSVWSRPQRFTLKLPACVLKLE